MTKKNLSLTAITEWLNQEKSKKNNKPFTVSDVQGYISRGRLPKYLGGNKIVLVKSITCTKLYNIT